MRTGTLSVGRAGAAQAGEDPASPAALHLELILQICASELGIWLAAAYLRHPSHTELWGNFDQAKVAAA